MKQSPALQFVQLAWDSIPHASWQRLNAGMYSALSNAIGSGMKFEPGNIGDIYNSFRAHYWIGESIEGLYGAACGGKRGDYNLSAAISIEKYLGREPWLWAEDCKTPKRLHVGSRFTWKGQLVTVTSFNDAKKSLIACTYRERDNDIHYMDGKQRRLLSERIAKNKTLTQKFSAPLGGREHETEKIRNRFNITFDELMAVRKAADAKVRKYIKEMARATDASALKTVWGNIRAEGSAAFRHFDVETLRAALTAREAAIEKSIRDIENARAREEAEKRWKEHREALAKSHDSDLARWMKGENVDRGFDVVRLRINGEFVETSTMQRATVVSAKRAVRFINKYREAGWQSNGDTFEVDKFPITSITADEVVVGCTTIPLSEVDRIAPLLCNSPTPNKGTEQ